MRPDSNKKAYPIFHQPDDVVWVAGAQVVGKWQTVVERCGVAERLDEEFGGVDVGEALGVGGCLRALESVDGGPDGTCES